MKNFLILTVLVFVSGFLFYQQSSGGGFGVFSGADSFITNQVYKKVEAKEFDKMLKNRSIANSILLDVRTEREFRTGHIPKSNLLDYKAENFKSELESLDRSKTYFIYCTSGYRSDEAFEMMKKLKFANVYELLGGIEAWEKDKLPVIKSTE